MCICVVAQIKISHEADAVPIRIKKPNHRSSVAQMRLQRHTAKYRKQNIPKTLLGLVPALLDFPIHPTHVDTACNTRCLPLILPLYSPWYFWMHCMVAFSPLLCNISHSFQWTYYKCTTQYLIPADLLVGGKKYPKRHNFLSLLAFFVTRSFVRMIIIKVLVVMMMVILNIMMKLLLMIRMPLMVTKIEDAKIYAT